MVFPKRKKLETKIKTEIRPKSFDLIANETENLLAFLNMDVISVCFCYFLIFFFSYFFEDVKGIYDGCCCLIFFLLFPSFSISLYYTTISKQKTMINTFFFLFFFFFILQNKWGENISPRYSCCFCVDFSCEIDKWNEFDICPWFKCLVFSFIFYNKFQMPTTDVLLLLQFQ